MREDDMKEELVGLKGEARMNSIKLQAIVNLLAREGIISRKDVEKEISSLCEKGGCE